MLTNQPSRFLRKAAGGAAGNGLLNNLIAYWPMNEAGGANNALDLHGNGLTLTQNSSPGADTGKVYATARTFDGSADFFSRASEAALQMGDVDFTIAAWVYLTNVTTIANKVIVCKAATPTAIEYYVDYSIYAARFRFIVTANGSGEVVVNADAFGALAANEWHFVVAWHDCVANTINIAIDGGAVNSVAHATGVYVGTSALTLGWLQAYNTFLAGRIGHVSMWKSAAGGGGVLSEAQRAALWAGGAGLPYADYTA